MPGQLETYRAATEHRCDTEEVRRKRRRMKVASCSAPVRRNLNAIAEWMTVKCVTDFLPGGMSERMDRTYSMLSTNAKFEDEEGVETL